MQVPVQLRIVTHLRFDDDEQAQLVVMRQVWSIALRGSRIRSCLQEFTLRCTQGALCLVVVLPDPENGFECLPGSSDADNLRLNSASISPGNVCERSQIWTSLRIFSWRHNDGKLRLQQTH